jgi:hypothetical protein
MEKEELINRLTRTEYKIITLGFNAVDTSVLKEVLEKSLKDESRPGFQMRIESILKTIDKGIEKAYKY